MTKNEIREAARAARLAAKIEAIKAESARAMAALKADLATATPGVNIRPEYKWTLGGREIA